jgi:hypothetical protein
MSLIYTKKKEKKPNYFVEKTTKIVKKQNTARQ